jgi:hypothetical protein
MFSESVCQVAGSWVEVGSFRMLLVVWFMIFTVSVRNIFDTPSYCILCRYFVSVSLDDTKHEFCYFGLLLEGAGKPGYQIVMLYTTLTCTAFCSIDIYNFFGCFMDENFKNLWILSQICYAESYHIITHK